MTSDGSPYPRLLRAINSGNLALIHATAAEFGWVPLRDALAILLVIKIKDEASFEAAVVRWAGRLALEVKGLELENLAKALAWLGALPDEAAKQSLVVLSQRATRPPDMRRPPLASRRSQQGRRRGLSG